MIGMTPAWLTFSGRYCRVPPKTRRPRTCLADCVGIRRWLSVIAITPTTTATNSAGQEHDRDDRRTCPCSGVSLGVEFVPELLQGQRASGPGCRP